MSDSDILGVIWSPYLHHDRWGGYGLVVTADEVLGSKARPWADACSVYLGPSSRANPDERAHALKVAAQLAELKEFELHKSSIFRIDYHAPGQIARGHVVFRTANEAIELKINPLIDGTIPTTLKGLIPSLVAFASDRFYDEKTGTRVGEVILKTGKYPKS